MARLKGVALDEFLDFAGRMEEIEQLVKCHPTRLSSPRDEVVQEEIVEKSDECIGSEFSVFVLETVASFVLWQQCI